MSFWNVNYENEWHTCVQNSLYNLAIYMKHETNYIRVLMKSNWKLPELLML